MMACTYQEAFAVAILVQSKTVEGVKNKWATQWPCFLDARMHFELLTGKKIVIDVAAEPQTAKVNRYLLPPDWINNHPSGSYDLLKPKHEMARLLNPKCVGFDGLLCAWDDGWWCNPPFDLKQEFLQKAVEEMFKGHDGIMLLPYEPLSGWWIEHVEPYAKIVLEPNGRYPFYEADGRTKKQGVNFGSVLVIFTRKCMVLPRQRIVRRKYKDAEIAQIITEQLAA